MQKTYLKYFLMFALVFITANISTAQLFKNNGAYVKINSDIHFIALNCDVVNDNNGTIIMWDNSIMYVDPNIENVDGLFNLNDSTEVYVHNNFENHDRLNIDDTAVVRVNFGILNTGAINNQFLIELGHP